MQTADKPVLRTVSSRYEMWKRLLALVTKTTTVPVITLKWVTSVANRNQEYLGIPKASSYRRSLSLSRAFVRILEALCNQYQYTRTLYGRRAVFKYVLQKPSPIFFRPRVAATFVLFLFQSRRSINQTLAQSTDWHRGKD